MNAGVDQGHSEGLAESELERRTRELLLESAEALPGAVRSRLTQARHAALSARSTPMRYRLQRWVPAGAMAAAALTLLVVFVPRHHVVAGPGVGASIEDIDLLTSDVPLTGDQDVDYEFYEWAVAAANDPSAGTAPGGAAEAAQHGT